MQQSARNTSITVNDSSVNLCTSMVASTTKRVQVIIINTSSSQLITIAKQDNAAVLNEGIRLQPNGVYAEATDGGYTCWQGAIQAIGSAAGGSVSVVETFETK